MNSLETVKQSLQSRLMEKIDFTRDVCDSEIQEMIDEEIILTGRYAYLSLADKNRLAKELFFSIRKMDILQELVEDESVTEIMVNGLDKVFVERGGKIIEYNSKFHSKEKLSDVIQQIVGKSNRVVNEASPIVDARLENGARVNVVMSPVALNGPILTIRRFPDNPIRMAHLVQIESISEEASELLQKLVRSGYNIFISGGTGSGKTTFLNALSEFIPKTERVITIEDSAELRIQGIHNLVRLETRNANVEGCIPVTIRDLIKASLRMRPDRIIVGEVRGSEAIDMLSCLNTGHNGSLSTGHGNNTRDMLFRLETMVLMGMDLPLGAIRRQIASGIDILVHLGRMRDKTRKVLEITEVVDYQEGEIVLSPLYVYHESLESKKDKVKGCLVKVGQLKHIEKLSLAGIEIQTL